MVSTPQHTHFSIFRNKWLQIKSFEYVSQGGFLVSEMCRGNTAFQLHTSLLPINNTPWHTLSYKAYTTNVSSEWSFSLETLIKKDSVTVSAVEMNARGGEEQFRDRGLIKKKKHNLNNNNRALIYMKHIRSRTNEQFQPETVGVCLSIF